MDNLGRIKVRGKYFMPQECKPTKRQAKVVATRLQEAGNRTRIKKRKNEAGKTVYCVYARKRGK